MRRNFYREKILEVMEEGRHWSARQLFEALREVIPTLSVVTVYRNLHVLEEEGKVRRVVVGEETLWERVTRPPHLHFRCRLCGRVEDVPVDLSPLAQKAAALGKVEEIHGVVEGICHRCMNGGKAHEAASTQTTGSS